MPESFSSKAAAWAQVGSALVGLVAACAAVVVGWYSYQQGKGQEEQFKTQQALEFFATFNDQGMIAIRRKLSNERWCARYEYWTAQEYLDLYGEPYDRQSPERVSREDVLRVVDFFDTVNTCVEREGCQPEFVNRLFAPYAREFYDDLSGEIRQIRNDIRTYDQAGGGMFGEGMAALAGRRETPIDDVATEFRNACGG